VVLFTVKDPTKVELNTADTKTDFASVANVTIKGLEHVVPANIEEEILKIVLNSVLIQHTQKRSHNRKRGRLQEKEYFKDKIKVIHLHKSVGKKQAIEAACEITKDEIFLFMDSDCDIASDAVEKAVQIFLSDTTIGAVIGYARVRGADKGGILIKITGCLV
jgi:iron-sulfur cluster repair protein YtfE (RIC family)